MLKIGITGGIGSGKTTVAKVFHSLGIPIFDADIETKKLYENNQDLKDFIKSNFGEDAYKNNKFQSQVLSKIVFNNPDLLKKLNSTVHPIAIKNSNNWLLMQEAQGYSYAIKEAALLIESDAHKFLDKIILVLADEKTRIQRVIQRNNISADDVKKRMLKQMSDAEKIPYADFIVYNNDNDNIIEQVLKIHNELNTELKKQ